MSLPGLIAQPVMTTAVSLSPFDAILSVFNTNPYFIGLMMLVLNLGGRFIVMDVSKEQERFFQHPWVRRFLIFVVLFVATRNVFVAFWMTIAVVLVMGYLFNENSSLCLFGSGGLHGSKCEKEGQGKGPSEKPGMTPEEMEIFRRLNEKQMRYSQADEKKKDADKKKSDYAHPAQIYLANVTLLRN